MAEKSTVIESITKPIRESLNALFKTNKTVIILLIAVIALVFALGYVASRESKSRLETTSFTKI